ncbi:YitT family protein [Bacillus sp. FJAT-49711]|uniref:YczE/YyaS/YitT family protein n=1 Tax=Bacillus sp. FJAT-49711 TaxID=2833585 RepID=UPI001BC9CDD1|nr:YitT family protein [Bacillus sp. FJAT-49711]MBS4219071.1 YitT family protein [Bacillus sp. FJAT-49711]
MKKCRRGVGNLRLFLFILGMLFFSYGISMTIKVQHLGISPWDVLHVGLFNRFGLSIGSWGIIVGITVVMMTLKFDRKYVKFGTVVNIIGIGLFVDLFLWLDFLPQATHTWSDIVIMILGIIIMGVSGGMINAAHLGSGPRDGFMLSMAEKFNAPIGRVRIIIESIVLLVGLLLGGPVFIFTFIITFIQSPIFQYSYLKCSKIFAYLEHKGQEQESITKAAK